MPLGIPKDNGKESIVAVTAAFDRRTLARLRETRGDDRPAITHRPAFDHRARA
jgi:acyl-homoserine lactone synthase